MATTFIELIFALFTKVGDWIVATLGSLTELFWTQSGDGVQLTFLGALSLVALGISVIFLMIRVIQNFLHFRG